MTSVAAEHVLGPDGVAIVVSRANPLESLTLDQVEGLFSGRISNWADLGGPSGPVHIYSRASSYGSPSPMKASRWSMP